MQLFNNNFHICRVTLTTWTDTPPYKLVGTTKKEGYVSPCLVNVYNLYIKNTWKLQLISSLWYLYFAKSARIFDTPALEGLGPPATVFQKPVEKAWSPDPKLGATGYMQLIQPLLFISFQRKRSWWGHCPVRVRAVWKGGTVRPVGRDLVSWVIALPSWGGRV